MTEAADGSENRVEQKSKYASTQAILLLLAGAGFVVAYMAGSAPAVSQSVAGYVLGGLLVVWALIRYHERQAALSTGELEVTA